MFQHVPVLIDEVLALLAAGWQKGPGSMFRMVDCTLGSAGHATQLVRALTETYPGCGVSLIGLDQDSAARSAAESRLAALSAAVPQFDFKVVAANFRTMSDVLQSMAPGVSFDIILADIGVSSHQFDTPERGFSITSNFPLDMRMNPNSGRSAMDLLQELEEEELARIFFEYAEEPRSRKLARAIVSDREAQLLDLTSAAAFARFAKRVLGYHDSRSDPAIRIFQALRIAVNDELGALHQLLDSVPLCINPHGGRLGIITFHSLEDRIVKKAYRRWEENCYTPEDMRAGLGAEYPRGGLTARVEEAKENPRSRSARLRVFHFGDDRRSLRKRFARSTRVHPEAEAGDSNED